MAHFSQIDSNSIVLQVIVVDNSDAPNEAAGIAFCKDLLGADTNWVQTSYNNNIRYRYAGIGMKYDSTNDVFYYQQPYPSWILNTSTWVWDAPVAIPDDDGWDDMENPTQTVDYTWDEDTTSWANRTVSDISRESE
jgi:hypothetical protein